ncbi:radical SAM protein [Petrotoga olearia]|uniref:Fe-S oxidoreductase n=2 Tax=Petrotoga olearia TaxID=156203 RepID=A0A2K1NYX5_9BACT|nr:radical SAM protein [Petrotoga olearia]PNR95667.1 Fe-S oxidoreductase [Petrotoga olearia DSM 13574]RMA68783.1 wyosine [tRNA(Phe)-imidazoG37] synthetase (radical SAM superfamily) [Petrotoga olearia]
MNFQHLYGPIPSRRLGRSLGVSPIPLKTCNFSCVYCQLGRTVNMTNQRKEFFDLQDILGEFDFYIKNGVCKFDFVTIVGEGEPLLYSKIGELIKSIKAYIDKPVAVITNGALLSEEKVREELSESDLVMPTLDAYDQRTFKRINRPHKSISFDSYVNGLISFSKNFKGKIWMEFMMIKGLNDDEESLRKIKGLFNKINYDRLYINLPMRPPAEDWVKVPEKVRVELAQNILGGISLDFLAKEDFYSSIGDDFEAILSIIKRHPMNQYEIESFLNQRKCENKNVIFEKLGKDEKVEKVQYFGLNVYRLTSVRR